MHSSSHHCTSNGDKGTIGCSRHIEEEEVSTSFLITRRAGSPVSPFSTESCKATSGNPSTSQEEISYTIRLCGGRSCGGAVIWRFSWQLGVCVLAVSRFSPIHVSE